MKLRCCLILIIASLVTKSHISADVFMVFASPTGVYYQLMVMNLATESIKQITYSPGDKRNPSWSPDGSRIVCENQGRILMISLNNHLDAVNESYVSSIRDHAGDPRWSNNNELIYTVYSNVQNDHTSIWKINLNTETRQKIIDAPFLNRQCDSKDTMLTWVSGRETFGYEIYVFRNNSEGSFQITDNHVNNFHPRWSPDATHVSYQEYCGTASVIVVKKMFTDKKWTFGFDNSYNGQPTWNPTNDSIVWVSNKDGYLRIYQTSLNAFEPVCLTPPKLIAINPDVWSKTP